MTERLHFHFSLSCIGEGNGNPLQCSCLENPRDGGQTPSTPALPRSSQHVLGPRLFSSDVTWVVGAGSQRSPVSQAEVDVRAELAVTPHVLVRLRLALWIDWSISLNAVERA